MHTDDLRRLVTVDGPAVLRANNLFLQRVGSLLDLRTDVPPAAFQRAIDEEIADLRADLTAEENERLGPDLDTDALTQLAETVAPERVDAVARARRRFVDLGARVGWLNRPASLADIQRLDPRRDCDQIYHFVSYEFRVEQKLFATLFEVRPTLTPQSTLMFHSTGEFTLRAVKRITDTVLFFSNLIEWGLESRRGREAIARLNGIHGRYHIASDTFKFILANIMFVPLLWNERLGWRPFTEIEKDGWFHAFARVGRAMNIRDIPDDRMEMCAWWEDYSARYADRTEVQRKTFDEIALQVLATYPEDLRKLVLTATLAGMDDLYRNALGYPAPPPAVVDEVRTTLRVVGGFCASLPRIPWARSLQTFPLGYDLGRLGVSARSAYMPPMAGDERPKAERLRVNGGYPEHVRPLGAGEAGPFAELPIVDRAEVARHDTPEKAWMVIDGLVYDVTVFLQEHPGGARVLLPHLGKDATAAFARIGHSPEAKILMHNFRVARLADAVDREPASVPRPDRRRLAGAPEAEGWDETVDAVLAAVRAFEANRPRTPQGDEMARFPVQLPSHQRPQGAE